MSFAKVPLAFIVLFTLISFFCFVYDLASPVIQVFKELTHVEFASARLTLPLAGHHVIEPLSIVVMLELIPRLRFEHHRAMTVKLVIQELTNVSVTTGPLVPPMARHCILDPITFVVVFVPISGLCFPNHLAAPVKHVIHELTFVKIAVGKLILAMADPISLKPLAHVVMPALIPWLRFKHYQASSVKLVI